jgi:hypothetical protein
MAYYTIETDRRLTFYLLLLDRLKTYAEKVYGQVYGDSNGAVLARFDLQNINVDVKTEYFIYIKTYGVPEDGYFNEILLERIRMNIYSGGAIGM